MKSYYIAAMLTLWVLFANGQQKSTQSAMKTKSLKQFSLLVRVPTNYSPAQVKAASAVWDQLIEEWKSRKIYVISFAFPGNSYVVFGSERIVTHQSVVVDNLRVVSVLILWAPSIEEACIIAKEVPVLAYGGSVEIRELPKPLSLR